MTLSEAITRNNIAYAEWRAYGQHEADDILNDSNRELIRAYQQEYPNANTEQAIAEINAEPDELKKMSIAERYNGIYLVWT